MKFRKADFETWIIHEDDDFLAVNKPPQISTLEDRNDELNMLALARMYAAEAQVCHRLDKDTSGALVFAKNPEAYRYLSMGFEKRDVDKIYHAIIDGIHDYDNVKVDEPIAKKSDGTVKLKSGGKPALTYFTTLAVYREHSLVECRPVTGRMHQIRIHFTALGVEISGDEVYGGKSILLSSIKRDFKLKKDSEEQPLMPRMALHARSVAFEGPAGEKLRFEAEYPKDFRATLRQLELNR